MPRFQALLFDLDGTLIDSSTGILRSLEDALAYEGLIPILPLEASLIGPPLHSILQKISGVVDPQVLDRLASSFKAYYDGARCLEVIPFPGIETMLAKLTNIGIHLYIVTNKRTFPTQRILDYLGWNSFFNLVYSIDTFDSPLPNKESLIARLLIDANLDATQCAYVGDREEDRLAACANNLEFYWAAWGFDAACYRDHVVEGVLLEYTDLEKLLGYT